MYVGVPNLVYEFNIGKCVKGTGRLVPPPGKIICSSCVKLSQLEAISLKISYMYVQYNITILYSKTCTCNTIIIHTILYSKTLGPALYYTILYYTILYYTILYYTILYYTILGPGHVHVTQYTQYSIQLYIIIYPQQH